MRAGGARRGAPIAAAQPRGGVELELTFARAEAAGRAAFVAYVTAGDPDLATTERLLPALGRVGVDVVELGVPFSDPIADGPVIQRTCERALANGTSLAKVIALAARAKRERDCPRLVLFSYLNPIHRMGYESFAKRAAEAGIDGVLLTDLPIDEPEPLREILSAHGLATIPLLSPTSGTARLAAAKANGSGFAYYISRTGVTGARAALEKDLEKQVARVRRAVPLPVTVGFGISTPEQVTRVACLANGVVVGSALVAEIARAAAAGEDVIAAAGAFASRLTEAARRTECSR